LSKIIRILILILGIILLGNLLILAGAILGPLEGIVASSLLVFIIFLTMIAMTLLGIFSAFIEFMVGNKQLKMYKEPDPSIFERVIRDGFDGAEYLVGGHREETFGHACQKNWQFTKTDRHTGWIIKDERGNDITNASLASYDGIAIIVSTYGEESMLEKPESDTSSDYTSIDEGVEYYD
jgi:ABC-type multidrug transport system fused ATPase/permease subunit